MHESRIFAPNTTGQLHIGSALVLWVTAKLGMLTNDKLLIRLDDQHAYNGDSSTIPDWYDLNLFTETMESVKEACSLLDIKPDRFYTAMHRSARYLGAVEDLKGQGELVADRKFPMPTYRLRIALSAYEWRGQHYDTESYVLIGGAPSLSIRVVCDSIDFNVKEHVRGYDTRSKMFGETRLLNLLAPADPWTSLKVIRYLYVPELADETGKPLHKTNGIRPDYYFSAFCKHFKTPEKRRKALERILVGNSPFDPARFVKADMLSIRPDGQRVQARQGGMV